MSRLKVVVVLGIFLWPSPGQAQGVQPESLPTSGTNRPVSLGSVQIYPSLSIRDVGMDSNVYNSSQVIRDDFTYTVAPRVLAEMPLGNGRVVGTGGAGFVFFRDNKDQQSVNASITGLYDIRKGRVRPSLEVGMNRSRQRTGDIDVRALGVSRNGRAAIEVGLSGITSFTAWAARDNTEFAPGQAFRGIDLAAQLDRKTTAFAAGARFDLTPLTTMVVAAEYEQLRFVVSRFRDSNSLRITPTVRFGEGAVINGQASVGVRDFRPTQPVMAPFRGLVAGGDLQYTLLGVTKFEGRLTRDIVYSYDELQPYYLDAGGQLTVSQRVVGPIDAIVLGGRRQLQYEARLDAGIEGRQETVTVYGGGFGVRVDDNMRMTFTVDREKRVSSGPVLRQYERTRAFVSLEYKP
jgi:hypothetical protein